MLELFKRYAPFLAVFGVLFGLSETASAWALTDLIPTDLKAALSGIPTLFTEYSGYILSGLGIVLVLGLIKKFL